MRKPHSNSPLLKKLKTQIVKAPESNFMFAIIEQAVNDATAELPKKPNDLTKMQDWVNRKNQVRYNIHSAKAFLTGDHCKNICSLIGLDVEWFNDMLVKAKVI